jgi:phospholipid-translocating ATPase/phospholipid-transporting ATPase
VLNGYTGQKWYIEFGSQTFNLIYSSLPIIILAVYDRDLDASWVLRYPKLYDFSRLNRGLNVRVFASWYADGFLCAVLNTIFTLACFDVPDVASRAGEGATPYIFVMGTLAFTNAVIVLSLRVAAEMNRHYSFFQIILMLSVLLWVPAVFLFDVLAGPYTTTFDYMFGGARVIFGSASFWLSTLLFSGMLGAKMMGWKAFKRFAWPELRHLAHDAGLVLGRDGRVPFRQPHLAVPADQQQKLDHSGGMAGRIGQNALRGPTPATRSGGCFQRDANSSKTQRAP